MLVKLSCLFKETHLWWSTEQPSLKGRVVLVLREAPKMVINLQQGMDKYQISYIIVRTICTIWKKYLFFNSIFGFLLQKVPGGVFCVQVQGRVFGKIPGWQHEDMHWKVLVYGHRMGQEHGAGGAEPSVWQPLTAGRKQTNKQSSLHRGTEQAVWSWRCNVHYSPGSWQHGGQNRISVCDIQRAENHSSKADSQPSTGL